MCSRNNFLESRKKSRPDFRNSRTQLLVSPASNWSYNLKWTLCRISFIFLLILSLGLPHIIFRAVQEVGFKISLQKLLQIHHLATNDTVAMLYSCKPCLKLAVDNSKWHQVINCHIVDEYEKHLRKVSVVSERWNRVCAFICEWLQKPLLHIQNLVAGSISWTLCPWCPIDHHQSDIDFIEPFWSEVNARFTLDIMNERRMNI